MKRWIISDTHFNHKNIIQYCGRPFNSIEDMNEGLICNWNNKVAHDDLVYHLGDFSLTSNKEFVTEIVKRLNGQIILIMGNHDQKPHQWYMDCGFVNTTRKPIIVDDNIILMNEPPKEEYISNKYYYCFGHVHDKIAPIEKYSNTLCVCVERLGYYPLNFQEIINERNIWTGNS